MIGFFFPPFIVRGEDKSLSRKEILESVNQSCENLGLDYIDLVLINKFDPGCPIEGK